MHNLLEITINNIVSGLKRKAVTKCSTYAKTYRIMGQPFPGPYSAKHHPWIIDVHDCESDVVVAQKAAQMGFTEVALNKTFYTIDIKGASVLYILPAATPDASDFSTSRFDPALELSEHLTKLFTDVQNIGHKRAGNANLFIRGSRSRSQLKSLPVALIIMDEKDEMIQENIALAYERISGQLEHQVFELSTPTIEHYGINVSFRLSTQNHFMFRCPRCSRFIELDSFDNLVITADDPTDRKILESHLICKACKGILPHESKLEWLEGGKWVETHTDRLNTGFWIPQLYSMTVTPAEIAKKVLLANTDPAEEQELWNSKMGLPHTPKGAKIDDDLIKNAMGGYKEYDETNIPMGFKTIGIDVGKWLHYEIDKWTFDPNVSGSDINLLAQCQVLKAGKVLNFEEIDILFRIYGCIFGVIDAHPEKRKAVELAQRLNGHMKLCLYPVGINNKIIHVHADEEFTISVDRTSWMDLSLGRFKRNKIKLPYDISNEYKTHIKAPVRILEKDNSGNPIAKYITGNEQDHFAHARTYSEIALRLGVSLARSEDITEELN